MREVDEVVAVNVVNCSWCPSNFHLIDISQTSDNVSAIQSLSALNIVVVRS